MTVRRLPFPALAWQAGGHPLEQKKLVADAPAVLLEFAPGFADPHVCERGHAIFVVEGALGLELDGDEIVLSAGEACLVAPGDRHRAKNPGPGRVVLFVAPYEPASVA